MIDIAIPGDKSISHRSLMLAALANGESRVRRLLVSGDVSATALCLRELGVELPPLSDEIRINGVGLHGLRAPSSALDCANSGTTARLLMGIVAGQNISATFAGDESLRGRPMRRVTDPLRRMGALIEELGDEDRLPLRITGGKLHSIDYISPRSSAQVKSAVLLAAVTGGVSVAFSEPVLSRDHTERMLNAMGMELRTVVHHGGMRIELDPVESLEPFDAIVPADLSSAAFFLARGLLAGPPIRVQDVGVNATRSGFLDVVRRMHGTIQVESRTELSGEPIATMIAEQSELVGTRIDGLEVPRLVDEIPIIAVLATQAEGTTEIVGAGELRVKESDRLSAMVANLKAIGAHAEELHDGLVVQGGRRPLRGRVRSHGDHRVAMAFGILGSLPGNDIKVDDESIVDVSFPEFWNQLALCRT
ncbi:MAG TPA: 3-phosphoshikimate 1-carboxyvinyltransferase [Longimicrobiales bacterium]